MKSNECRVCGGQGSHSKGIVNFHNVQTSDKSKEFETKILDCLKCEDCGHSWIPEKSDRELALKWWNNKNQQFKRDAALKHFGYHWTQLSNSEIEEIWRKETQESLSDENMEMLTNEAKEEMFDSLEEHFSYSKFHNSNSKGNGFQGKIVGDPNIRKPNQKQFKEFNLNLANAYVDKFDQKGQIDFFKMMLLKMQDMVIGYVKIHGEWIPALNETTAMRVHKSFGFSMEYFEKDKFEFRRFPFGWNLSQMINKPYEYAKWCEDNLK